MRKIAFILGEYYHCYNRGVEKREIFLDRDDYLRFITLLYVSNSKKPIHISNFKQPLINFFKIELEPLVAIGAYCLMPNHFHLLIKELQKGGISLFMQKLTTAYAMYFNKKLDRKGSLFEGVFKSEHADTDEYLKYLFSYIHLNPIKLKESKWKEVGIINTKEIKEFLENYEYSSYQDYMGKNRLRNKILTLKGFPNYFVSIEDFNTEIINWLSANPRQG